MPTISGILGMTLPESFDKVDVSVLSNNFSLIDLAFGQRVTLDMIANNLETEEEGKVLDARQGKVLLDSFIVLTDEVNTRLDTQDESMVSKESIADDLITDDPNKVLSAAAGKMLSDKVDAKLQTYKVVLPAANWVLNEKINEQTVNVPSVTADINKTSVIISPPTDATMEEEFLECEVRARSQGDGTLMFAARYLPAIDVEANILVIQIVPLLPSNENSDGEENSSTETTE